MFSQQRQKIVNFRFMQETLVHPPKTIMEVFQALPEGTLAEVIDNSLYMSPAPIGKHQRISMILSSKLFQYAEEKQLGLVFTAPYDVYLDRYANAVQPDIFFIASENLKIYDEEGYVKGVPDLIIEILSPSSKTYDINLKKDLYEKFGVAEYWVINPDTKQSKGYSFNGKSYELIGEETGKINSILLGETFSF